MASNIIQRTIPGFWSSANDDIEFVFDFTPEPIDSVVDVVSGSVSEGKIRINLQDEFLPVPAPGDRVYIASGIYKGLYTIDSVIGNAAIIIDTPYIGAVVSNADNIYHLRVPVFNLYKGYKVGELFETDLPYSLVTSIRPSVLFDSLELPYLSINVKGIAMYLFSIVPKTDHVDNVDFSMFNVIRFLWDDVFTVGSVVNYVNILNSAITNEELNERYLVYGYYLTPIDKPLIFTDGVTFATRFDRNVYPVFEKIINGDLQ
jgi:hypothetical protein